MTTWTAEYDDLATKLWREGKSAGSIALDLAEIGGQFSRNAVIGRIHRLGLGRRTTRSRLPCGAAAHRTIRSARAAAAVKTIRKLHDNSYVKILPSFPVEPVTISPTAFDDERRAAGLIQLLDLEDNTSQCRFEIARDDGPGVGYCGCPTVPGTSWCEHHLSRVAAAVRPRAINYSPKLHDRRVSRVPAIA